MATVYRFDFPATQEMPAFTTYASPRPPATAPTVAVEHYNEARTAHGLAPVAQLVRGTKQTRVDPVELAAATLKEGIKQLNQALEATTNAGTRSRAQKALSTIKTASVWLTKALA